MDNTTMRKMMSFSKKDGLTKEEQLEHDTQELLEISKLQAKLFGSDAVVQYKDNGLGRRGFYVISMRHPKNQPEYEYKTYVGELPAKNPYSLDLRTRQAILQRTITDEEFLKIMEFQFWMVLHSYTYQYIQRSIANDYISETECCGILRSSDHEGHLLWEFICHPNKTPGEENVMRTSYKSLDTLITNEKEKIRKIREEHNLSCEGMDKPVTFGAPEILMKKLLMRGAL